MREVAVSTLTTNLTNMIGVASLLTAESTAAVRSFNRFGRLAWDRTTWPFASRITQVIPDVRVRSVDVGNGGSSYSSAPSVAFSGGGGSSAAATATINSDGEVNGVAMTNNGTGYTGIPTVSFSGGGGSGATATANLLAYLDFGTTISEVFRVTEQDPYGSNNSSEIAFRNVYVTGSRDYGGAIPLINLTRMGLLPFAFPDLCEWRVRLSLGTGGIRRTRRIRGLACGRRPGRKSKCNLSTS